MNILLIDVNPDFSVKDKGAYDLAATFPPVGLMYIASYLKKRLGERIKVKVLHEIIDSSSPAETAGILQRFRPDIVGIRGLNIFRKRFHEVAQLAKETLGDVIVVGGGPYVTMSFEDAALDENLDYLVTGEGEITFTALIEALLQGRSGQDVDGLSYRRDAEMVKASPRAFIEDLDALPFPDYSLSEIDHYAGLSNYGFNRRRQGIILSSRGCPGRCIFCHRIFGQKTRARSPENVFREIESLHRDFGIKDFYFIDDNFSHDYQRATDILELIIRSGMEARIYFRNGLRADTIDADFIDKMKEAGCVSACFAIETAAPRLQKLIGKNLDLNKAAENIDYACERGIMVGSFAMIGFPSETKEEALGTIEYFRQFKKLVLPMLFCVKYHPNTEIYDLALSHGIKADLVKDAYAESYHDIAHSQTPLISNRDFKWLFSKFLREVVLSEERLANALKIQKRLQTKEEMQSVYKSYLKEDIGDLEKEIFSYGR
ncbi:MAG: B12-binding domain-containing radical SAM protein [Candidatus Omnitrophica bacterium]|nr:B12-binding domain-containing radical SAM protein [Candidatus Omnitrophota bacterium]